MKTWRHFFRKDDVILFFKMTSFCCWKKHTLFHSGRGGTPPRPSFLKRSRGAEANFHKQKQANGKGGHALGSHVWHFCWRHLFSKWRHFFFDKMTSFFHKWRHFFSKMTSFCFEKMTSFCCWKKHTFFHSGRGGTPPRLSFLKRSRGAEAPSDKTLWVAMDQTALWLG